MRIAQAAGASLAEVLFIPMRDYEVADTLPAVGGKRVIHPHEGL